MKEEITDPGFANAQTASRIVESRLCAGCDRPCGGAKYCPSCASEVAEIKIGVLRKVYAGGGPEVSTREKLQAAMFAARVKCAQWLWLPGLIFIGIILLQLGAASGDAVLDWIRVGDVQ